MRSLEMRWSSRMLWLRRNVFGWRAFTRFVAGDGDGEQVTQSVVSFVPYVHLSRMVTACSKYSGS
jgi:hypothetical protein